MYRCLTHKTGHYDKLACAMSSRSRDPESAEKDRSDRKERKHKHRDRDREGKSKHRTAEAPLEEDGGSHPRQPRDRVS